MELTRLRNSDGETLENAPRFPTLTDLAVQSILSRANAYEPNSLPELPAALLERLIVGAIERSPIHVRAIVRAWSCALLRVDKAVTVPDAAARMLAISIARNERITHVELWQTTFASEDGSKAFLQLSLGNPITQNVTSAPPAGVRPSSAHFAATHESVRRAVPLQRLVVSGHVSPDAVSTWRAFCADEAALSVLHLWKLDASYGIGVGVLGPLVAQIVPSALRVLTLGRNLLGNEATLLLVRTAHRFPLLEELDLSYNRLGGSGGAEGDRHATELFEQLCVAFSSIPHLKKLRLAGNALSSPRVRSLCNALASHSPNLAFLDLSGSLARDGCLGALAKLFEPSSVCAATLYTLKLKGHSISAGGRTAEAALLLREAGRAGRLRFLAMGYDAVDAAAGHHQRTSDSGEAAADATQRVDNVFAGGVRAAAAQSSYGGVLSCAFGMLRSLVYLDIGGVDDFVGCYRGVGRLVESFAGMPRLLEVRLAPTVGIVLLTGCFKHFVRLHGLPSTCKHAYVDGRKVWLLPHQRSGASSLQLHLDTDATGQHNPHTLSGELDALWRAVQQLEESAAGTLKATAAEYDHAMKAGSSLDWAGHVLALSHPAALKAGMGASRVVEIAVNAVAWPALADLFGSLFAHLRVVSHSSVEFDAHAEDVNGADDDSEGERVRHWRFGGGGATTAVGASGGEYLQLSDMDD